MIYKIRKHYNDFKNVDLKQKTIKFIERVERGESLLNILPEAFAVAMLGSYYVLGYEYNYFTILYASKLVRTGKISVNGETKTKVNILVSYLHSLEKGGVRLVFPDEESADNERNFTGPVFENLGVSTDVYCESKSLRAKFIAKKARILFLRDSSELVAGKRYLFINEDGVRIKEREISEIYDICKFVDSLNMSDVTYRRSTESVCLSLSGVEKAEKYFSMEIYTRKSYVIKEINNLLHMKFFLS